MWPLVTGLMLSDFIHVVTCFISFYCQVIFHCLEIPHFVHPLVNGHLGFHFLSITYNAAMNICTHFSVHVCFQFSRVHT